MKHGTPKGKHQLVREDDPEFARFWAVYPWHTAKLAARKAWAQVQPSPELVDRIVTALAWQSALWARQGYGTPYPATYLRGERWNDEPPCCRPRVGPELGGWTCWHTPQCTDEAEHKRRARQDIDASIARKAKPPV